jgi:oxygen-independent coproporphyrinogen-3 oxidase
MIGDIVRRYASLPVPRYTSYPTAAEFSSAVTAADHARWLRRMDSDAPVSIYLHVPYCSAICHYCGCHAKMAVRSSVIDNYRMALEAEIALVAETLPTQLRIGRLHWGGGTPSILGADGLSAVLDALSNRFSFEEDYEHAIELDPRHVDIELAAHLAACGVNRASLGVQDVDPDVQKAIGRIQPIEIVETAFEHLRTSGIDRINVDLIYGLPRQTVQSLTRTCATVGALGPDRIACYGYAHLPDRRANQRLINAAELPGGDERFEQSQVVAECFTDMGYTPIGTDHFARPDDRLAQAARAGKLRRNFQGYTDDDSQVLLAFGASAISRLPDGFVQNTADNRIYCSKLAKGELASMRGFGVDAAEWRRARIIEQLMCNFEVDLDTFDPQGNFSDELALLRPLAADGLLVLDNRKVRMTALGRPIVRVAAAVFDQFRRDGGGGFSPAV